MTTAFKIESGVPLPTPKSRDSKYPINDMAVGDSFFVPTGSDVKAEAAVRSAVTGRHRKADGRRYRVSRVDEGVRVWRTA